MSRTVLITGGAGFIGSALIRYLIESSDHQIVNVDKLTYAGNLETLNSVKDNSRYTFIQQDVSDYESIEAIFSTYKPDVVMHLAAESHVDRSIDGPAEFIQSNIVGTYTMLEVARKYWSGLDEKKKGDFHFHHISTDEVYGSLGETGLFTETTSYKPNSPYSASKASSDHLVRAWHETYGLPTVISNCSNNYGPFQYPEKLIPLVIEKAVSGEPIPIYGQGTNVRDWLYVVDHVEALFKIATEGKAGEVYNVGGYNEKTNLEVVNTICSLLDEITPRPNGKPYQQQITFVSDRPGHDQRYAIDASKIKRDLGWTPKETFDSGMKKTVQWYLNNKDWYSITQSDYQGQRLGAGESS